MLDTSLVNGQVIKLEGKGRDEGQISGVGKGDVPTFYLPRMKGGHLTRSMEAPAQQMKH